MEDESRIEKIFEALKNKVPVTEIHGLLGQPWQTLSTQEINSYSDIEKKVVEVITGLQMVEGIEKPIVHGKAKGNSEAGFIVRLRRDNGSMESFAVVVKPSRDGIRGYIAWLRNTYNLAPEQVDDYLKAGRKILINGGTDQPIIQESFLRQLEGIQKYRIK